MCAIAQYKILKQERVLETQQTLDLLKVQELQD